MERKKFFPFTENVIFFDAEFSTNDPYTSQLLSVGFVKLNGEELYLELNYSGEVSDWVKNNILHTLNDEKIDRKEAIEKIKNFAGDDKPYLISYVYLYDVINLHKLFESKSIKALPFNWLPIDLASIVFSMGYDPMIIKNEAFLADLGIDTKQYKHSHNSLDDAKLLKEVYLKLSS